MCLLQYYFHPKHNDTKIFENHLKPVVLVLAEYSQLSTDVPRFQLFFRFFAPFCIGQISHQQHKG